MHMRIMLRQKLNWTKTIKKKIVVERTEAVAFNKRQVRRKMEDTSKREDEASARTAVDLESELHKKNEQVKELADEVAELRAQNQELRFQLERTDTRSKMKSISEEKQNKEEIQRLQKELRTTEQTLKLTTSDFEAQLKVYQDKNDRLQEKIKIVNSNFDKLDKERLELKLENSRLQNKLDKSGSFVEMKRIQTVRDTVEMELENLKRKNEKLEEQLDSDGIGGNTSIQSQKRELFRLKEENKSLQDKRESLEQTTEVLSLKVKQLDDQLKTERMRAEEMEADVEKLRQITDSGSENYIESLLQQKEKLQATCTDLETSFKVKEKDLWLTIESQKKTIEELEIAQLKLELGDDDDEDESDEDSGRNSNQAVPSQKQASDELHHENSRLREEFQLATKISESKIASLQEKADELAAVNANIQNALDHRVSENKTLQSSIASCQEKLSASMLHEKNISEKLQAAKEISKQSVPSQEYQLLKQKLESLQKSTAKNDGDRAGEAARLKSELDQLKDLNSKLLKDLEDADTNTALVEETDLENEKLRSNIARLEEQNEKFQNDLEGAEDEIERMDRELADQTRELMEEIAELKETNRVIHIAII